MGKLIWILIIAFFLVGGFMIKNSLDTDFGEEEDRGEFLKEAGKWLFQIGKSTTTTAGYAVKQEWLPDVNKTNSSEDWVLVGK